MLNKTTQGSSEANNNVVGGGVNPNLVEGLVNDSAVPVQKHPHPKGQIGVDQSNEFQHGICVTCEQLRHVLERPVDETFKGKLGLTDKNNWYKPFTGSRQTVQAGMEQGALQYGQI